MAEHHHADTHPHDHPHDHTHTHDHEDAHDHQERREPVHGASPAASVILELSERIGALIIEANAALNGVEIEISRPEAPARTHSMVRERLTQPVRQYSAVYPSLEAGEYTVWHGGGAAAGTVVVQGGHVTRFAYTAPGEATPL